jgi:hypothetical protein
MTALLESSVHTKTSVSPPCIQIGGGGERELNVDRRFDPILIVDSTIIFRNSFIAVARFLASKTCRLQTHMVVDL